MAEFVYLVDVFKALHPQFEVGFWLLEFGSLALAPAFGVGKHKLALVVPVLLFSSSHLKRDVCLVCNFLQAAHPGALVVCVVSACARVLMAGAAVALKLCSAVAPPAQCRLLVVARGSSDAAASAMAYFVARLA